MAADPQALGETNILSDTIGEEDVRRERRTREWADAARYIHWVGIAFLGVFLVSLINAAPPRFADPAWLLNLISLALLGGATALIGTLFVCLGALFNLGDRQVHGRAMLVRTLASWVALGWLLLIPLQLFLGVRLINSQIGQEIGQIQSIERIARSVRNATSEDELRSALARVPNQPPMPKLTVPLEIAKANLLAQFQKNINAAKNRQDEATSNRWQNWMKEVLRNSLQCAMLGLGFLAIGKNRLLDPGSKTSSQRRSRSGSRA